MHHSNHHSPTIAGIHSATRRLVNLIRLPGVEQLTGLSRSSIYAGMRAGTFPGSVRLGARAVAWREGEVLDWCAERAKTGEGHE